MNDSAIFIERKNMTSKTNDDEALVSEFPDCDFKCGHKAKYDSNTKSGIWSFMCLRHWNEYGVGKLGIGFGQKLIIDSPQKD